LSSRFNAGAVSRKDDVTVRPISWLHISDIHMCVRDAWSQDVVLAAMCDDIKRQRTEGTVADFILVTGDLAFSGKTDEYTLVGECLDAICAASTVPKTRMFCIPGNHDIDRDRQKMCFQGARHVLQSQSHVDSFLSPGEDMETLLRRQENYRHFQRAFFVGQDRTTTDDGLAYVSRLTIDDVRIAILGLDSAWLAEGGATDHGNLVIGERQLINAINLAQECDDPPHIVVGMAHHPFHLLREFDRPSVQNRVERACQFFHCGHLHAPEARHAGLSGTGCLTLAAGAEFETRHSHNSYSVVLLDLLRAERTVKTVLYSPGTGAFAFTSDDVYSIEVTPAGACSVSELATAMKTYRAELSPWAHYLSALLRDQMAEIPIAAQNGHTFGSLAVLQRQPDSDLKRKAIAFMAFKNALRVLYKRVTLSDIFIRHGDGVAQYGAALEVLSRAESALKDRLAERETDAQMLASAEPRQAFSQTGALLAELATAREWVLLREHAQRHLASPDPVVVIQARRMLALALAHSSEAVDREAAIALYRSLTETGSTDVSDAGIHATLLWEIGRLDEAKAAVLDGIGRFFANRVDSLLEVGQRIVEATGDRDFRSQMTSLAERGNRG
jgi:uncharacterized protein (DUF924 family)